MEESSSARDSRFDPNRDLIVTPASASRGALIRVPLPDGSASGHALSKMRSRGTSKHIMRFVRDLHNLSFSSYQY